MVVWGISQLFGVGEVVDIIMLAVGVATLGKNGLDFATDLATACNKTLNAKADAEFDEAAQYLAKALVEGGVEVVMALLLRRDLGQIKVKIERLQAMKPGLLKVGPPPLGKPKVQFVRALGSGADHGWVGGVTDPYGNIKIAREGYTILNQAGRQTAQWVKFTSDQKMEVILHELVHRYFSPRFGPLQQFRASIGAAGYKNIYLLQYIEEALAQGYARTRTQGLRGVWEGIQFPVKNGYVSIMDFAASGGYAGAVFLGRIYVSGRATNIYFSPGHPPVSSVYSWKEARNLNGHR